jgi:hypothetical protein
VTDLAMGQDRWAGSRYDWDRQDNGRHAFNEDAVLTPIFHALTTGGWQERQHEPAAAHRLGSRRPDPVADFRRDPLTAPIPVQAITASAVPEQPWRRSHLRAVDPLTDSGRHRRITENWSSNY